MKGIEVQNSAVEAYNSIDVGTRIHGPFKRTGSFVRNSYPKLGEKLALGLSINAMNDSLIPDGLVPSLRPFGFDYIRTHNQRSSSISAHQI